MQIKPELSKSLQIANLLATLLVIAIHYTSKFAAGVPTEITTNFFFQELLTNNLARVAVPMFAFLSGFFLFLSFSNNSAYPELLKKRWKTLLLPYVLASTLIYAVLLLKDILTGKGLSADIVEHLYSILITPRAGQFWFLRDLILLVILAPLILALVKYTKGLVLLPVTGMWLMEIQLFPIIGKWYLLNIETIFFFMLGCFMSARQHWLDKLTVLDRTIFVALLLLWLILSVIRVYIDPVFSAWYRYDYTFTSLLLYKLSILIGIPTLIAMASYRIFWHKKFLFISGFTFFAYMFHTEPVQDVVIYLLGKLIEPQYVFYLSFPLVTILVFSTAWFCEKYLSPVYMLLTGNRSTKKVMTR